MTKFAHIDTKRPDGAYIEFERIEVPDDTMHPTEYLFQDDAYKAEDEARLEAFNRGDWRYVGVMARAHILVVRHGVGTHYSLDSAGLWGVEDDSGEEYLESIFEEEKSGLQADIALIGGAA